MSRMPRQLVDSARMMGKKPRVHGNGMIQLDLPDEGYRLHFWGHWRIPRQVMYTPIHNHNFSFRSEVLAGELTNIEYALSAGDTWRYWEAKPRKGSDTELQPRDVHTDLKVVRFDRIMRGGSYLFEHTKFHETITVEPTITVMHKLETYSDGHGPYVLIRNGGEPDNVFDRHSFADAMLWEIIEDML